MHSPFQCFSLTLPSSAFLCMPSYAHIFFLLTLPLFFHFSNKSSAALWSIFLHDFLMNFLVTNRRTSGPDV